MIDAPTVNIDEMFLFVLVFSCRLKPVATFTNSLPVLDESTIASLSFYSWKLTIEVNQS